MSNAQPNLYRGFRHSADIDAAYNPSLNNPQAAAYIADYATRSELTRSKLHHLAGLRYGEHPRATLDFFPGTQHTAPLHVFFHGGYWRALSAQSFSFMANALVEAGQHVAIVNYPLLPEVTLPEQIAAARKALVWLWQHATDLHIMPHHITLLGHSAGAHLVASCLTTDWTLLGLPQHPWARALYLSGLFDLAPFPHSWLQPELQLRNSDVATCSPLLKPIPTGCATLSAVGAHESTEFERQSRLWQSQLQRLQPHHSHRFMKLEEHNHFSILDDLALNRGPTLEFLLP